MCSLVKLHGRVQNNALLRGAVKIHLKVVDQRDRHNEAVKRIIRIAAGGAL